MKHEELISEIEEKMHEDEEIVRKAGYLSYARFLECQHDRAEGMIRFGSKFVRALGRTLKVAHRDDALKIMRYWNNCSETHATLYKMYLAKIKAVQENPDHA